MMEGRAAVAERPGGGPLRMGAACGYFFWIGGASLSGSRRRRLPTKQAALWAAGSAQMYFFSRFGAGGTHGQAAGQGGGVALPCRWPLHLLCAKQTVARLFDCSPGLLAAEPRLLGSPAQLKLKGPSGVLPLPKQSPSNTANILEARRLRNDGGIQGLLSNLACWHLPGRRSRRSRAAASIIRRYLCIVVITSYPSPRCSLRSHATCSQPSRATVG